MLDPLPSGHAARFRDPFAFARLMWPKVRFYREQQQVIESVRDNPETVVVAGHQLGKDFVSAFIALWFFVCHQTVRIVATSVEDRHLDVLWGEMGRFIDTAAYPLDSKDGGPLILKHRDIRKVYRGSECSISYLKGITSAKPESLAGHHASHTLLVVDEASGVDDEVFRRTDAWAKRRLIVGNPYPCSNYFYKAVEEGSILA